MYRLFNKDLNCEPYNLRIISNDNEKEIIWYSQSSCASFIKYGNQLSSIDRKELPIIKKGIFNTKYQVRLNQDMRYLYIVVNGQNYYLNGKVIEVN